MTITWNQVRILSSMHDNAELECFRNRRDADECLQQASMLEDAAKELFSLGRSIRHRRVSLFVGRRLMMHNNYSRGLRVLEQAVGVCRRRAKRQKMLYKLSHEHLLQSASNLEKVIGDNREALLELLFLYDGGNIIKVLGASDISALRKVRDLFPHKLIRFSIGSSVRSATLEEIQVAAKQLLQIQGMRKSRMYELRQGVFYKLTRAQIRGLGIIF